MMAHSSMSASSSSARRGRVVGDYIFGRQIGSGSFSVVWHARHRRTGDEVAVKEIAMERLSRKLQESLQYEIEILKRIRHPNIIAFLDIIQTPGRWFLVLEYCKGGDLSMFIQRHGKVPEATAKYFMQQLASGLQVLRENNLIHRDLKPQNLLLSRNDDNSLLKIADFGFARSLQPRVLAETLCGSPLYMAPEIMQLQKYDAKADLWSVGAILFQLVTGKTPYTGNNQIQLLQNIMKSSELCFPVDSNDLSCDCIDLCQKLLRRNPVERLTFEEFFNHPFLPQNHSKEPMSQDSCKSLDASLSDECSPARPSDANSLDECLPFILDDLDGKSETPEKKMAIRSTYGFSVDTKVDRILASKPTTHADTNISTDIDIPSKSSSRHKLESPSSRVDYDKLSLGSQKELKSSEGKRLIVSKEEPTVIDSLEFIDQEYVIVSGPPLDVSSSSLVASRPYNYPFESENSAMLSPKTCPLSAPMPIIGVATAKIHGIGNFESRNSPSGTSQGSLDMGDAIEQPSSHCMTRIRSLQQCASAITELVNEKVEVGRQLEAFSIQLVILAIWKQALHICHAQAASATEGSPSHDTRLTTNVGETQDSRESLGSTDSQQPDAVCSQIEKAFLMEVGNAEELAKDLGPVDETMEMPDAMEMIFQSALALGRNGAVEELMDNMESATTLYSKAVQLLYFLLVEASSLILNPPLSLTTSDRFRLRSYIDILNNRQSQYRSQRMALLKSDIQGSP